MKFSLTLFAVFAAATNPTLASELKHDRTPIPGQQISFEITANGMGNLGYQIDCVSGFTVCTQEAYQQLWESEFHLTYADRAQIKAWKKIKDRYGGSLKLSIPNDLKPGIHPRQSGVSYEKKLRIAALSSHSISEFREKLRLLMRPTEADELADIAESFLPRFQNWWNHTGFGIAQKYERASVTEFKKLKLIDFFQKVAHFYQSKLPKNETIIFNIIARAPSALKHTSAEELENYSTLEARPEESPDSQIDVIAHEAFHHLYDLSTIQDHVALIQHFIDSPEVYSIAGYNLLNESLATVFGNGLVKEMVQTPEEFKARISKPNSFYSNEGIDLTAKALLPTARRYLEQGLTIQSPSFVSDYLKAYQSAVGTEANRPALALKILFVFFDERFDSSVDHLVKQLKTNSSWTFVFTEAASFSPFKQYPYSGSVFLITPKKIPELSEYFPKLKAEIAAIQRVSSKNFLYGLKTNTKIINYIAVAENEEEMKSLTAKLADAKAPFEGLYPDH